MKVKKPTELIVVFADPAPVIHLNEGCTHREVTVQLTPEQSELLQIGMTSGSPEMYEFASVFILDGWKEASHE
jgi:hypothetical protein